jgi:16S rRNA (uracil1498-N3)-methyltransferase
MVFHRDKEHEFALHIQDLAEQLNRNADELRIDDSSLVHRISHVLRLQKDDTLVLFDASVHVRATVQAIEKKAVTCSVQNLHNNKIISPLITVWLPMLKREAFEQAIYTLAELGVARINIMSTAKEQRHWHGQKEMQRVKSIMIAAAEQSKHFAMPVIVEPLTIEELCAQDNADVRIFFDAEGEALFETAQEVSLKQHNTFTLIVGPEGDLTDAEKFLLQKHACRFVRLTPTILRAQQAVAVGVGAVRSLF